MNPVLTIEQLLMEASVFAAIESVYPEPSLYGVTDGKAIGTYVEHKFKAHLAAKYAVVVSSSAMGIDLP
ncbi:MAG: restriction endonuclease, partial [Pyrinomonadaceae bacterium]|nr:restriction endonuclease [Pyrinomonadaceae bacterium]